MKIKIKPRMECDHGDGDQCTNGPSPFLRRFVTPNDSQRVANESSKDRGDDEKPDQPVVRSKIQDIVVRVLRITRKGSRRLSVRLIDPSPGRDSRTKKRILPNYLQSAAP